MKKIKKATTRGPKFDCIGRITEFIRSGKPCDRVRYPHKNAQSCAGSMKQAMKREGIRNVKVIRSGNYIILLKLDM